MKRKPKPIRSRPFIITAKTPVREIIRLIRLNSQRCTLDFR